jgi:hypothetical protein
MSMRQGHAGEGAGADAATKAPPSSCAGVKPKAGLNDYQPLSAAAHNKPPFPREEALSLPLPLSPTIVTQHTHDCAGDRKPTQHCTQDRWARLEPPAPCPLCHMSGSKDPASGEGRSGQRLPGLHHHGTQQRRLAPFLAALPAQGCAPAELMMARKRPAAAWCCLLVLLAISSSCRLALATGRGALPVDKQVSLPHLVSACDSWWQAPVQPAASMCPPVQQQHPRRCQPPPTNADTHAPRPRALSPSPSLQAGGQLV